MSELCTSRVQRSRNPICYLHRGEVGFVQRSSSNASDANCLSTKEAVDLFIVV
jgi:hypothetical protein